MALCLVSDGLKSRSATVSDDAAAKAVFAGGGDDLSRGGEACRDARLCVRLISGVDAISFRERISATRSQYRSRVLEPARCGLQYSRYSADSNARGGLARRGVCTTAGRRVGCGDRYPNGRLDWPSWVLPRATPLASTTL